MINYTQVNKYCCDDPSLIENYNEALNDKTQTWAVHHRLETDENISMNELITQNKYFNRPASELIFLTNAEHTKIHMEGEKNWFYGRTGKNHPMYSKNIKDYMTEEAYNKWLELHKGKNNPAFGHCWMHNGIDTVYPKKEDANKYIELGYHFGRI